MTEREEKAVAFLRREADRISGNVGDQNSEVERLVHIRLAASLSRAADAIERGDHLKRPEPTIPFASWKDEPSVGH